MTPDEETSDPVLASDETKPPAAAEAPTAVTRSDTVTAAPAGTGAADPVEALLAGRPAPVEAPDKGGAADVTDQLDPVVALLREVARRGSTVLPVTIAEDVLRQRAAPVGAIAAALGHGAVVEVTSEERHGTVGDGLVDFGVEVGDLGRIDERSKIERG